MGLSKKPKKGYSVAFAMFEVQVKGHMPSRVFWTWRILPWFSQNWRFHTQSQGRYVNSCVVVPYSFFSFLACFHHILEMGSWNKHQQVIHNRLGEQDYVIDCMTCPRFLPDMLLKISFTGELHASGSMDAWFQCYIAFAIRLFFPRFTLNLIH